MNWKSQQTPIDITGTVFPRFEDGSGKKGERFWYVRDEFVENSQSLLNEGKMFSSIGGHLVGKKWICDGKNISKSDIASFVWKLRLFYLKSENMSIYAFCSYMEKHIKNKEVNKFFSYLRRSWNHHLENDLILFGDFYPGPIRKNKQLIDVLLYSGNFHSQEKYKKRYDELLEYYEESLILKFAYNAMHGGHQMAQICAAIKNLHKDNLVIMLPNHLQHEWNENCPYEVIRRKG